MIKLTTVVKQERCIQRLFVWKADERVSIG